MTDTTVVVSGLRKRFGRTLALDGMSFAVQPGRITGFVGPNGAGKSTTMRVVLGPPGPAPRVRGADGPRQAPHDACRPRPGPRRRGPRARRRPPVPRPRPAPLPRRLAARRRRAAAEPHRPQPPALAGALAGP